MNTSSETSAGTGETHAHVEAKRVARPRPNPGSPPSTPRWVKVLGIVGLVLVVLFVGLHLTGNSPFGHMMHTGLTEQSVQQP